uniref:THAP domain-containing protein 2-like n=1 Tax=Myxine glutinosa TaxID=7769 RepID=UPI00358F8F6E
MLWLEGCCAIGCTNRSERGFKMYRFPADPGRKKIWENKVRRLRWKPTRGSFLCQKHFDAQQFESRRIDGKWRLKCHAVPTIFFHHKKWSRQPRKSHKKRSANKLATQKVFKKKAILPDHTYCASLPADSSPREPDRTKICGDKTEEFEILQIKVEDLQSDGSMEDGMVITVKTEP